MKSRKKKQEDLDALRARLGKSPTIFVAGFNKLTVAQDFELRKTVRGAGGRYQVLKNTIAEKASAGSNAAGALAGLTGMNAMALTEGDPVALAKALSKYAKDNPTFTFKVGVVEGRVVDVKAINDLSSLPPKEEIYAKLLYLINAPAQRLVTALNGAGRNVAAVLDQGVQNNKFSA
ncbi:MAG: 50S ribosomal protein L10 [Bryobacterales bacterium]|nr:50S ribosomal protein L10 [Bryobacterales bacterium]